MLVAESKKGRYVYYHCTGHRGKCPEPYTREELLVEQFTRHLGELLVPPEVTEWLQATFVESDLTEALLTHHFGLLEKEKKEKEKKMMIKNIKGMMKEQ